MIGRKTVSQNFYILILRTYVYVVTLPGKRDLADGIKVKDLEMKSLP